MQAAAAMHCWRILLVCMRPLPWFLLDSGLSGQVTADPPDERTGCDERVALDPQRQPRQAPRGGAARDAGVVFRIELRLVARTLEHVRGGVPCPVAAGRVRADGRQRDVTVRRIRA